MKESEFKKLLSSVKQAGKIKRGEANASRVFEYKAIDVKKLREETGLSQNDFSHLIQISKRTLQHWEQGDRQPQGAALALLKILKNNPVAAIKALQ